MTKNIGSIDRVIRIVLGLALLSLLVVLEGNNKWFGLIGIVPLATAFLSWCPLYSVVGIKRTP